MVILTESVYFGRGDTTKYLCVIDFGQHKMWTTQPGGKWVEYSKSPAEWDSTRQSWNEVLSNLDSHLNDKEVTFATSDGFTLRLSNIHINPELSDLIFQPT